MLLSLDSPIGYLAFLDLGYIIRCYSTGPIMDSGVWEYWLRGGEHGEHRGRTPVAQTRPRARLDPVGRARARRGATGGGAVPDPGARFLRPRRSVLEPRGSGAGTQHHGRGRRARGRRVAPGLRLGIGAVAALPVRLGGAAFAGARLAPLLAQAAVGALGAAAFGAGGLDPARAGILAGRLRIRRLRRRIGPPGLRAHRRRTTPGGDGGGGAGGLAAALPPGILDARQKRAARPRAFARPFAVVARRRGLVRNRDRAFAHRPGFPRQHRHGRR